MAYQKQHGRSGFFWASPIADLRAPCDMARQKQCKLEALRGAITALINTTWHATHPRRDSFLFYQATLSEYDIARQKTPRLLTGKWKQHGMTCHTA